jgi:hypothetical protein
LRPLFVSSCLPSSIKCAGMTICFFIMSANARVAPSGSCSKMASMICRHHAQRSQHSTAQHVRVTTTLIQDFTHASKPCVRQPFKHPAHAVECNLLSGPLATAAAPLWLAHYHLIATAG